MLFSKTDVRQKCHNGVMEVIMNIVVRVILTLLFLSLGGGFTVWSERASSMLSAEASVGQLANSDAAYLGSQAAMSFLSGVPGWVGLLALIPVLLLWWGPLRRALNSDVPPPAAILLIAGGITAFSMFPSKTADASFTKYDNDEFVTIQPNESAFMIPMQGANVNTQAQFGSLAYYQANKVAAKRVKIPHMLQHFEGWANPDMNIPSVELIVVDRTPYQREWTNSADTGTTTKKEGVCFQSKEGINGCTGISIAATVDEENAATFLYHFGTEKVRGRSLAEVMDTVVRGKIVAEMNHEFTSRSFVDGMNQASDIILAVEKRVQDFFKPMGISITYVGLSGTMEYDQDIQRAINLAYEARLNSGNIDTLKQLAGIDLMHSVGVAFEQGHPVMPSTLVNLGSNNPVAGLLTGLVNAFATNGKAPMAQSDTADEPSAPAPHHKK
jgi:hypothetical protein